MKKYYKSKGPRKTSGKAAAKPADTQDFINPLDFFDTVSEESIIGSLDESGEAVQHHPKGFFVVGTDYGVGKTIAICALGELLKQKNCQVAAFKPVECGGEDANVFSKAFEMNARADILHPYVFKEKGSPYSFFKKQKNKFDPEKIKSSYDEIRREVDVTFVEGTGGLFDPINDKFSMADLARQLGAGILLVAPLDRGSINHIAMTVDHARNLGLMVHGVLFTETAKGLKDSLYQDQCEAVKELARVAVVGMVPFLEKGTVEEIREKCAGTIDLSILMNIPSQRVEQLNRWKKEHLLVPEALCRTENGPADIFEFRKNGVLVDALGKSYIDTTSMLDADAAAIELAGMLSAHTPEHLNRVLFSHDESAAIENALKTAIVYWQAVGKKKKTRTLRFSGSSHGYSLSCLSLSCQKKVKESFTDMTFKTSELRSPALWECSEQAESDEISSEDIVKLEGFLKKHSHSCAALILEPGIQFGDGVSVWPEKLLPVISELCHKYQILVIADECRTGFGRLGEIFISKNLKFKPDLLCAAHGAFADEFFLGMTVVSDEIYDKIEKYEFGLKVVHSRFFPKECRALIERLKFFEKTDMLNKVQKKIKYFQSHLESVKNVSIVRGLTTKGLFAAIEIAPAPVKEDAQGNEASTILFIIREAKKHGVLLARMGQTIVLMPPVGITKPAMDLVLKIVENVIKLADEQKDKIAACEVIETSQASIPPKSKPKSSRSSSRRPFRRRRGTGKATPA